jgi:hypothetical protein
MTTIYVIAYMLVPILGYEIVALVTGDVWTWSSAMRYLGQQLTLSVPFAAQALLGHFWVQPPPHLTLAGHVGEATEVGVVVWATWMVHILDKGADPTLHWWGWILYLMAALCIGGFCWTMGA